jgi:hypothetical protein
MSLPPVARAVLSIRIPMARSLKDKRSVIQSLIGQVRSRYAVAIAETDNQDNHNLAEIGLAVVSGQEFMARQIMDEVLRFAESLLERHGALVTDLQVEIV